MARKKKLAENIRMERFASLGKCVGHDESGKVILVENTLPGDVVDVRLKRNRKSFAEGFPIKFIEYSDLRQTAPCEHFEFCGGCKWQNVDYQKQLEFKTQEVYSVLEKIGGITIDTPTDALAAPDIFRYRNKMEYTASNTRWLTPTEIQSDEVIEQTSALGFHVPKRWDKIIPITDCHLQETMGNDIRNFVDDFCKKNNYSFYDLVNQEGFLRNVMIRNTTIGDWMIMIQFGEDSPKQIETLLSAIKEEFEITSIQYAINTKRNDSIYDLDIQLYSGTDYITEELKVKKFRIRAKTFFQTNTNQAIQLYDKVVEFANLTGKELVYDLYTGTGSIAIYIADKASRIVGIETVPDSIQAAKENAELNGVSNCEFLVGDMKDVFTTEFVAQNGQPDVVITDPPREGMHKDVVQALLDAAPPKIIYVSCNVSTQARDLEMLKTIYSITNIQPVDMFPHTHHIENIVVLEKK